MSVQEVKTDIFLESIAAVRFTFKVLRKVVSQGTPSLVHLPAYGDGFLPSLSTGHAAVEREKLEYSQLD